jgi:hypothetical protein
LLGAIIDEKKRLHIICGLSLNILGNSLVDSEVLSGLESQKNKWELTPLLPGIHSLPSNLSRIG